MVYPSITSIAFCFVCLFPVIYCNVLDCHLACRTPIGSLRFDGPSSEYGYQIDQCTNRLRLQSIYVCMRSYCTETEIKAGLNTFADECMKNGHVDIPSWSIIDDVTSTEVHSWPQLGRKHLNDATVYKTPVCVSQSLYRLAYRTSATWNHSVYTRTNYGYAMYGFFAGVFSISALGRLLSRISDMAATRDTGTDKLSVLCRLNLAAKRYLTTPALFTRHVSQPVGCFTIPQRIQSLAILAFILINIILCSVSYDVFEGNLYWPDTCLQFWRYFADRTGVIAISNLPLMFAFAMRNNVLICLTGWNFATYNIFHRWVARVATFEAVVHSVAYSVVALLGGGKAEYFRDWAEQYWWMGVIATMAMCLICAFSAYPLRKQSYELFLLIHIAFSVFFLIGLWCHVNIFEGEYNMFVYPCIGVWILDRLLRFARLIYLNIPLCTAAGTYNAEADLIRIEIPVRSGSRFEAGPGTHYYIYGCNGLKFWESHPFTLSTWETSTISNNQQILTFLIRPYDSFTGRLKDRLLKSQNWMLPPTNRTWVDLPLAVEGPYGQSHIFDRYNSILFITGGTGIAVALSHIQALHEALLENHNLPLRHIQLVWAVRDEAFFHDVHQNDLAKWMSHSHVTNISTLHIEVYVTRNTSSGNHPAKAMQLESEPSHISPPTKSHTSNIPTSPQSYGTIPTQTLNSVSLDADKPLVNLNNDDDNNNNDISPPNPNVSISIFHHRPHIPTVVLDAAAAATCSTDNKNSRLAIVCCGPAAMADDTRAAVVAAYAKGYAGVDFHSETFTW